MNRFDQLKVKSSYQLTLDLEKLKSQISTKYREIGVVDSPAKAAPLEAEMRAIKKDMARIYFILKSRK